MNFDDNTDLIPTRESLLSRLRDWDDQSSWNQFFQTYWKLIFRTAVHAGLSRDEAEDVVQETVLSVCKKISEFRYDPKLGSFKAWLLKLTQWRITDRLRRRVSAGCSRVWWDETGVRGVDIEEIPDPARSALEALWDEEWGSNLRDAALEQIKLRVDPRQYQVFDHYVIQGVPLDQVCELFQVKPGWVYLIKHRINRLLKRKMQELQATEV